MREVVNTVRSRLSEHWLILLTLFLVTVLDDLLSDTVSISNLLPNQAPLQGADDAVVGLQRAMILCALALSILGWQRGLYRLYLANITVVTLNLVATVGALIFTAKLPRPDTGIALLGDGFLLWIINVLVFSVWYWFIDSGGRVLCHSERPERDDFLFPQRANDIAGWKRWSPEFFDYLFLAFNASTAFSPTDTLFLSWRGTLLMIRDLTRHHRRPGRPRDEQHPIADVWSSGAGRWIAQAGADWPTLSISLTRVRSRVFKVSL